VVAFETLKELYDYNYWARDRQLEACETLTEEQFLRPMGNSFSSLRDTLAHLLVVEWAWYERFRGRSPRSLPSWLEELRSLPALRGRWAPVEQDLRNYLAGLDNEALARTLTYINLKGETWTYPLWQTLFHLVNHQTYHRGQVTTLLRQLGARPGPVDFLVYFDARG
jgi:uncharacterized damage-inducible protein DinB